MHPCLAAFAFVLAISLGLGGCASPSPRFLGAEEQRVTIGGTQIAVFRDGDHAQAIRLDYAGRAARRDMPERLVQAIGQTTGCSVRPGSAEGDSGVITARIDC
ncbi:hypothetical protein [Alkalilacustris brevis]|uniref:hypothetical protein n=1 Tax=Alkalilacustris brevis TaxID=2026338 RepID=UPI0012D31610|nr:hypothetical protein [Alkalilacustris brevis]